MDFVVDTFLAAWKSLTHDLSALFRVIVVPVAVLLLILLLQLGTPIGGLLFWLAHLGAFLGYVVLATNIHRLILLQPSQSPATLPPVGAAAGFAIWAILTGLLAGLILLVPAMLVSFLGSAVGQVGTIAATALISVMFCYVAARMAPILPDRAIGQSHTLTEIVDWSKDKGVQLAFALFAVPFVATTMAATIDQLVPDSRLTSVVIGVAQIPLLMIEISLLSVAYQVLAPDTEARQ